MTYEIEFHGITLTPEKGSTRLLVKSNKWMDMSDNKMWWNTNFDSWLSDHGDSICSPSNAVIDQLLQYSWNRWHRIPTNNITTNTWCNAFRKTRDSFWTAIPITWLALSLWLRFFNAKCHSWCQEVYIELFFTSIIVIPAIKHWNRYSFITTWHQARFWMLALDDPKILSISTLMRYLVCTWFSLNMCS